MSWGAESTVGAPKRSENRRRSCSMHGSVDILIDFLNPLITHVSRVFKIFDKFWLTEKLTDCQFNCCLMVLRICFKDKINYSVHSRKVKYWIKSTTNFKRVHLNFVLKIFFYRSNNASKVISFGRPEFNLSKLEPGTHYSIQLFAENKIGAGMNASWQLTIVQRIIFDWIYTFIKHKAVFR